MRRGKASIFFLIFFQTGNLCFFFYLLDPFINLTFSSMRQSSLLRKTPILNRPGGEYSSGTCKLAQKNKETKTATTILVSPCPVPQKTVVEATRMSESEGPMGES